MDIENQLKALCNTKQGPYLRPFRPNPDWKNAPVFIVGANPATPLREEFRSFEEYWDALTKQPAVFERVYFKARGGEDSKTTKRVKELCGQLGVNYLVTNASAYPANNMQEVPAKQWEIGENIFRLLLTQCRPRVVFTHGKDSRELVERVFSVRLDPYTAARSQNTEADGCLILCAPHLSGAGMKKGTTFSVASALSEFATRIRAGL